MTLPLADALPQTPWTLSTWYPVVLLPVRLETRFDQATLKIRVYPDQIHIDDHEPGLTAEEEAAGRTYWGDPADDTAGPATGDGPARTTVAPDDTAWAELVRRFGEQRAGWIARVMEPDPTAGDFPDPLDRPGPWCDPARVRLLPNQWIAVGRTSTGLLFSGTSGSVTRDLAAGLTPIRPDQPPTGTPLDELPPESVPVDDGMRWMVDYAVAQAVGMAFPVTVPTDSAGRPLPIARLLVFGVDAQRTPDLSAQALGRLLEAHAATDGLAFLPPGTPTNNTETVTVTPRPPVAPVTGQDTGPTDSESAAALAAAGLAVSLTADGTDLLTATRRRATRANAPTSLARAAHADRSERRVERRVRRALWPATLGGTLRHLLPVATPAEQEQIREHFVAHVHSEGPLPTLRIGSQPYGLLPVAALRTWQPTGTGEQRAVTVLRNLWQRVWLTSPVPRVRPGLADPEKTMVEILATDARVLEVRARSMLGNEYVSWLWRFARLDLGPQWRQQVVEPGRALLTALGLGGSTDPRLSLAVFAKEAFALGTPMLDGPAADGVGADEADPVRVHAYLTALAAVGLTGDSVPAAPVGDGPVPLFYRLLRAALIAEHSAAADAFATAAGLPSAREIPEPELVDVRPRELTATLRRRLTVVVPDSGGQTVGAYLATPQPADPRQAAATADLAEFRSALTELAEALCPPEPPSGEPPVPPLPPADLQRYLAGTLGLTAHRLDAWITSLATVRLDRTLADRPADLPAGVHVGAYGWVTDLTPAPPPARVARPEHVPATAAGATLVAAPDGAGHVHAPSAAQAVTAAVLRSAWRSHGGGDDNPVAVDLSSRRVRLAEQILDGMRSGQSLGALLGYRFERGLHDHPQGPLDQYLPLFRRLAPLRAHRVDATEDGGTEITPTVESAVVTDGLELHRLHQAGALVPELDRLPGPARAAVTEVLHGLADSADAVGDVLLAEGVHQLAVGDMNRAAAAVDVISGAATSPPQLHVTRTPNSGVPVTHRVMVLFNLDSRFDRLRTDWPAARHERPRIVGAAADALVSALLPPAKRVFWRMRWHAPDGLVATPYVEASLDALQIPAIDLVTAPPHPAAPDDADLDRQLELLAWERFAPAEVTRQWRLELDYDHRPGDRGDRVSLAEFLHTATALRDLLGRGRQVLAADLSDDPGLAPQYDPVTRAEADELWQAARTVAENLAAAGSPDDPGWDEDAVRTLLRPAVGFGVVGAVPPLPSPAESGEPAAAQRSAAAAAESGEPGAAVAEAAGNAAAELTRRLAAHCRLVAQRVGRTPCPAGACGCRPDIEFDDPTTPPEQRREFQVSRIRALLGNDMPVLSRTWAPQPAVLSAVLGASDVLQGSPHAVRHWLARYGRVRPAVGRLQEVLTYAEALDAGGTVKLPLRIRVAQLPYQVGDRWVGNAPPRPETEPLSMVVVSLGELDLSRPVHGLLVDEWSEVVPAGRAQTGLTFEYDAPAAAAPQAILLAVPADGAPTWQPASLAQTLEESLDLAIARAVDVDSLGDAGQFLPATYLPTNVAESATTTDFVPDAAVPPAGLQEGR
ncbi:hypothetical protein ACWDV4_20730 [Micromonospora sp. NPDC003197]